MAASNLDQMTSSAENFDFDAVSCSPNYYATTDVDYNRKSYHEPAFEESRSEYTSAAENVYSAPIPQKTEESEGKKLKRTQNALIVAAVFIFILMLFVLIELIVLISLAGRVTDLESIVETSDAQKTELNNDVENGNGDNFERISDLERNIGNLRGNITEIKTELETVRQTIGAIQSNLISLGNNFNTNTNDLQSVLQDVKQFEANLTVVEESVEKATNELDNFETSVDGQLTEVDTEIAVLQLNTSGNAQKLKVISGNILSIGTNLDKVQGKVVQIEQADFGTQIEGITDQQKSQQDEIMDVLRRLEEVEEKLGCLNREVEAKQLADLGIQNPYQYITCDGFIVIQQRVDNSNFDRTFSDYETGFGNPPDGSFWLGMGTLHNLTSESSWKLRVEVEISGELKIAEFGGFSIGAGNGYQFSITETFESQIGNLFSTTMNGENFYAGTGSACSGPAKYRSGWWLTTHTVFCGNINLNAPFCSESFCAKVDDQQYVQKTKMMIKLT